MTISCGFALWLFQVRLTPPPGRKEAFCFSSIPEIPEKVSVFSVGSAGGIRGGAAREPASGCFRSLPFCGRGAFSGQKRGGLVCICSREIFFQRVGQPGQCGAHVFRNKARPRENSFNIHNTAGGKEISEYPAGVDNTVFHIQPAVHCSPGEALPQPGGECRRFTVIPVP